MSNKNILVQAKVLFVVILANFLAQIPYFFHLYFRSQSLLVSVRSFLILGAVFAFFLMASFLLFKRKAGGYPLMIVFLSVEFLFYLPGVIAATVHGYGLFFHIYNPDPILRMIYSIGYLNLFTSGYFLFLLFFHKDFFRAS